VWALGCCAQAGAVVGEQHPPKLLQTELEAVGAAAKHSARELLERLDAVRRGVATVTAEAAHDQADAKAGGACPG
jgi:hypothetical protein